MKKYFYFIIILLVALSSCKKEETDTNTYAAVSVYNASPSLATYDVYLSDTKINSAALPFAGGIAYSQRVSGSYNLKFTTSGRIESLLTKPVALAANNYFSYYLIGRTGALDGVLFTDDLSATSTTTAFVRFINLSPDANAIDLSVKSGAAIGTKIAYKAASSFVPVTAGTITFEAKDNTNAALKATLTDAKLVANVHYTIIYGGVATPTSLELPVSLQLLQHK